MPSKKKVVAVIPARGGSKSIPKKNMMIFGGKPLISYVLEVATQCSEIERTICTTDDNEIVDFCLGRGVEVAQRPPYLATDESKISDVLEDLISGLLEKDDLFPEIVVLLQPTSPFVTQRDLTRCISLLRGNSGLNSVQTICRIPHNQHAFNQRTVVDGCVSFKFSEERKRGYNKQSKPELFQFGNVAAARTKVLECGGDIFAQPSGSVEIERHYSFDLDGPEDVEWGEYCLRSHLVTV